MFYLSDLVVTKIYGYKGVIISKDPCFKGTPEWLKCQEIPPHPVLLEQPWYTILLFNEGSIYVSESELEIISGLDIINPLASFYLRGY